MQLAARSFCDASVTRTNGWNRKVKVETWSFGLRLWDQITRWLFSEAFSRVFAVFLELNGFWFFGANGTKPSAPDLGVCRCQGGSTHLPEQENTLCHRLPPQKHFSLALTSLHGRSWVLLYDWLHLFCSVYTFRRVRRRLSSSFHRSRKRRGSLRNNNVAQNNTKGRMTCRFSLLKWIRTKTVVFHTVFVKQTRSLSSTVTWV